MRKDFLDSYKCPLCCKRFANEQAQCFIAIKLSDKQFIEICICLECNDKLFHLKNVIDLQKYEDFIVPKKIIRQYKNIQKKLYNYALLTGNKGQDQANLFSQNIYAEALSEIAREAMRNYYKNGFDQPERLNEKTSKEDAKV